MTEWRQRLDREGGSIPCRGNCPVHMSCAGRIRPRADAEIGSAEPIHGFAPVAECDTCHALFGFVHQALRFLDHTLEWKHSVLPGKPYGLP